MAERVRASHVVATDDIVDAVFYQGALNPNVYLFLALGDGQDIMYYDCDIAGADREFDCSIHT